MVNPQSASAFIRQKIDEKCVDMIMVNHKSVIVGLWLIHNWPLSFYGKKIDDKCVDMIMVNHQSVIVFIFID